MAGSLGVLAGGALVFAAVVVLVGWRAYRAFPEVLPREETNLSPRVYAVVRRGVVLGGAVGAVGGAVAAVDTVGTIAATRPGGETVVGRAASLSPEWAASAGLVAGAAVMTGCALLALASEVRAWREG